MLALEATSVVEFADGSRVAAMRRASRWIARWDDCFARAIDELEALLALEAAGVVELADRCRVAANDRASRRVARRYNRFALTVLELEAFLALIGASASSASRDSVVDLCKSIQLPC